MLNVLIARHGQSEWNVVGKWQGQENPPLSDLGRAQAKNVAERLGVFDAIFSSDLDRAFSTATIIAEGAGIGPVLVMPAFRERCAGEYEGLTRDEIEIRFPGALEAGVWPPGWEDDESVVERASKALIEIQCQINHGEVLVISHGGVIYSLEHHHHQEHRRIANLGARWFHHDGKRWSLGERVQLSTIELTIESQDIL